MIGWRKRHTEDLAREGERATIKLEKIIEYVCRYIVEVCKFYVRSFICLREKRVRMCMCCTIAELRTTERTRCRINVWLMSDWHEKSLLLFDVTCVSWRFAKFVASWK